MKRIMMIASFLSALISNVYAETGITLDYCLERARENYPIIKKFDLIGQTREISLSDINKGWLPRIGVFAQGTAQNAVSAFPDALNAMLDKTGTEVAGMRKFQYKAGVELNQTIWDGGQSKVRRDVERAISAQTEAALEVEMYAVRERVENLFFGILLMDEQMAKIASTIDLLKSNLTRINSMVVNGVAMQSDADMVEAQLLCIQQQMDDAKNSSEAYRRMLSMFIDKDIEEGALVSPEVNLPADMASNRPELTLFHHQIALNEERKRAVDATLMPKVGFFAQAYYGYPGFNMFESMMKRNPSFNALAGIKVMWNIDSFYTKKNSHKKLSIASDMIKADRELFLFNTGLKKTEEEIQIKGLRKIMQEDARIVQLRENVRRAAESQLRHGIIDTNALMAKISDETQAKLNASLHKIQLLRTIYQLKNTINR